MLEHRRLCLKPWQPGSPPGSRPTGRPGRRYRDILEPSANKRLGFAWEPSRPVPWRWLAPQVLEVYEGSDVSLLLSVRRLLGWRTRFEVLDADGTLRGTFYQGPERRKRGSRGLGCSLQVYPYALQPSGPAEYLPFDELATVSIERDGTLLEFGSAIEENPFMKMVVLAAVLVSDSP